MKSMVWLASVLASAIVLTVPQAIALTQTPAGNGETHVTSSDCMIDLAVPYDWDIVLEFDPDTLRVNMNVEWFDERSANSDEIIHRFQIDTNYGSTPRSAAHEERTTGGMSQSDTAAFFLDVPDVASSTSMYVYYSVSVRYSSSGTVLCSGDNSWQVPPTYEPTFNFF